jgi:hypothetical protein
MAPTLRSGDHLLVWLRRPTRPPRTGAVVVVDLPDRGLAVKRIAAIDAGGGISVAGDNPFGSTDSRDLGGLPADAIRGRVLLRMWPRPGHIRRS